MDDTQKMLKAIISGQSAMKAELLSKIDKVDKKLSGEIGHLSEETKQGFKDLTARVDKIGLQVASLEDDTPTREEHDEIVKRVTKIEQNVATI